jgi:polyisoprenoid-binding protein YceI
MRMRSWKKWALIGGAGLIALVVGGPFVYIHFIEGKPPPPLSLASTTSSPAAAQSVASGKTTLAGTWSVASGSQVGYRVKEVLFGQNNTAAGRTDQVTGQMALSDTTVTTAGFTVDMTTVASDQQRRDNQFRGRIMETSRYPTATFTLTKPIVLSSIPADGATATTKATGALTIHGVTKEVTFDISGRRSGGTISVQGSIPVVFAEYNIQNPSFGGVVQTEDHGVMEFLLNFAQ